MVADRTVRIRRASTRQSERNADRNAIVRKGYVTAEQRARPLSGATVFCTRRALRGIRVATARGHGGRGHGGRRAGRVTPRGARSRRRAGRPLSDRLANALAQLLDSRPCRRASEQVARAWKRSSVSPALVRSRKGRPPRWPAAPAGARWHRPGTSGGDSSRCRTYRTWLRGLLRAAERAFRRPSPLRSYQNLSRRHLSLLPASELNALPLAARPVRGRRRSALPEPRRCHCARNTNHHHPRSAPCPASQRSFMRRGIQFHLVRNLAIVHREAAVVIAISGFYAVTDRFGLSKPKQCITPWRSQWRLRRYRLRRVLGTRFASHRRHNSWATCSARRHLAEGSAQRSRHARASSRGALRELPPGPHARTRRADRMALRSGPRRTCGPSVKGEPTRGYARRALPPRHGVRAAFALRGLRAPGARGDGPRDDTVDRVAQHASRCPRGGRRCGSARGPGRDVSAWAAAMVSDSRRRTSLARAPCCQSGPARRAN